jgi:ABC-type nitrate/sulfonate/bicarbonate transport system substrate-binding protein
MTGVVMDTMPYQVVASREIQSMADLRGKAAGVNRFGGSADFVLRYALRQHGLEPETNVTMLQVGDQAARFAALRGGALQATVVDPPMQTVAEREGFRLLLDIGEQNIPYPQNALVMNREWIRNNRDLARRTLASVVEGAQIYRTNREVGERTAREYLKMDDPALLAETWAYWSKLMPTEPLPRPEGLQLVIDELSATEPRARTLRPDDLVDPSLAAELRR